MVDGMQIRERDDGPAAVGFATAQAAVSAGDLTRARAIWMELRRRGIGTDKDYAAAVQTLSRGGQADAAEGAGARCDVTVSRQPLVRHRICDGG